MTDAQCLLKIKTRLGYPYNVIEVSDERILEEIIYDTGLKTFSKFFPREEMCTFAECTKVEGYDSLYELPSWLHNRVITLKEVLDLGGYTDFRFVSPNQVRIFGTLNFSQDNTMTIIAKTLHSEDLTTIPLNQEDIFVKYCTILLAEMLLPIKKEFARLGTPIGDIEINTELLQTLVDSKLEFEEKNFYNSAKLSKRYAIKFSAPYA